MLMPQSTRQLTNSTRRILVVATLAGAMSLTAGCQNFGRFGFPFNASRVPPPGTGTYQTSQNYYNGARGTAQMSSPQTGNGQFGSGVQSANYNQASPPGFGSQNVAQATFTDGSGATGGEVTSAGFTSEFTDSEDSQEVPSMRWR